MVRGWADTDGESVLNEYEISFWDDKSVLELDSGDDCTGFSGGSALKNPPVAEGDTGSVPESERSFGDENDNPFLGIPMVRVTWQAGAYGVTKELDMISN